VVSIIILWNELSWQHHPHSNMPTDPDPDIASTKHLISHELKDDQVTNGLSEDAPANTFSIAYKKKEPPPEKPADIRARFLVFFSFWAIVLFLGLPIWWKTTAIYRAKLPLDQMMDWAEGRVSFEASIHEDPLINVSRPVDLYFLFEYPSRQILYKTMKHSIFCGPPSTPWTTSMTSRRIICVYNSPRLRMPPPLRKDYRHGPAMKKWPLL
jgi:hypothetical protein